MDCGISIKNEIIEMITCMPFLKKSRKTFHELFLDFLCKSLVYSKIAG